MCNYPRDSRVLLEVAKSSEIPCAVEGLCLGHHPLHFFEQYCADCVDRLLSTVALFDEAVHRFVDIFKIGLLELPLYHTANLCPELWVLIAWI